MCSNTSKMCFRRKLKCAWFHFLQLSFSIHTFRSNGETLQNYNVSNPFVDVFQESVNTGDAPERGPDTLGHEKARLWAGQVGLFYVSKVKQSAYFKSRWNGFGGKVEMGESVAEGAARELLEESCLNINWWSFLDDALNIKNLATHKIHLLGQTSRYQDWTCLD